MMDYYGILYGWLMSFVNMILAIYSIAISLSLRGGAFDLNDLPHGKNVTLLRSTVTKVPILSRVKLSVSENPQSVSFRLSEEAKSSSSIRLAIYDAKQDGVYYQVIHTGKVYSYSIKDSESVVIIPQLASHSKAVAKGLSLLVQSDKPLNIAR